MKFFISILFTAIFSIQLYAESNNKTTSSEIIFKEDNIIVTVHDVEMLLRDMTNSQKERILSDKVKLRNLLLDLIVLRKKAHHARIKMLHEDNFSQWKMNHRNDQFLSTILLNNYKNSIVIPSSIELLAKEYYDTNPKKFNIEEQMQVSHILISTIPPKSADKCDIDIKATDKSDKLKLAKKVLQELKDGLDFSKASEKYSDDKNSAIKGGKLGYIKRGQMVKEFEDASFKLTKDLEISPIIETKFGFHIIQRTGHISQGITPFNSVKDKLILQETNKYINVKATQFSESFNEDSSKLSFSSTAFNKAFKINKNTYLNIKKSENNE